MKNVISVSLAAFAVLFSGLCGANSTGADVSDSGAVLAKDQAVEGFCKSDGKAFSVGAVVLVGRDAYRCTPAVMDPHASQALVFTWVKIQLPPTKN